MQDTWLTGRGPRTCCHFREASLGFSQSLQDDTQKGTPREHSGSTLHFHDVFGDLHRPIACRRELREAWVLVRSCPKIVRPGYALNPFFPSHSVMGHVRAPYFFAISDLHECTLEKRGEMPKHFSSNLGFLFVSNDELRLRC